MNRLLILLPLLFTGIAYAAVDTPDAITVEALSDNAVDPETYGLQLGTNRGT